ncbi:uncharacterized protein BO95DRAFT_459602 [Aspergillus brunneoviolaceus CBS 621.78]|uniref:Uncharacterized protein n=1 Tax=Aspergillus brunneoviolaceus CBS 621.78 TaxID=1450534 RepID=A0ACD1GLT1_9EURO|nr:hypothetical protein BO95DRAFT_459602 [Aspergillus brunneoviolaceus CBS 621.78]RAH50092.1 hypothetical protein BO95DRAFT_459602 [Aspergillus brunneoviolaceus CBS 621.78]
MTSTPMTTTTTTTTTTSITTTTTRQRYRRPRLGGRDGPGSSTTALRHQPHDTDLTTPTSRHRPHDTDLTAPVSQQRPRATSTDDDLNKTTRSTGLGWVVGTGLGQRPSSTS